MKKLEDLNLRSEEIDLILSGFTVKLKYRSSTSFEQKCSIEPFFEKQRAKMLFI